MWYGIASAVRAAQANRRLLLSVTGWSYGSARLATNPKRGQEAGSHRGDLSDLSAPMLEQVVNFGWGEADLARLLTLP